jgi:methionyl-tRNA formyltransferase
LINDTIEANGGTWDWRAENCEVSDWPDSDWVVSFGYRKIIPHYTIERFQGQIINIHGSLLPCNKGANPNFWSWFNGTPKGVTIHRVTDAIDGGEILAQIELSRLDFRTVDNDYTLKTTYDDLLIAASGLFARKWPSIIKGNIEPVQTRELTGSYHRSSDKDKFMRYLSGNWHTPINEVEELGRIYRGE